MAEPVTPSTDVDFKRLLEELERLRREKAELERERERLQQENTELREKLAAQERQLFRQAAPFRVDDARRAKAPKKPGRKAGHVGAYRPRPETVDEVIEAAFSGCPQCGGDVSSVTPVEQFIEEIPPVRPHVTRLVTYEGVCEACGPVATSHPRKMSNASGAAAVQAGPRALGIAVDLNKRLGLPLRKTCDVLKQHFNFTLTPGAVVHAEARLAKKLKPAYGELEKKLAGSPVVCTDETSWWVSRPRWLWVFTAPECTVFRVDERRNADVVRDVLGDDYAGILSSDCLNIYDGLSGIQQKCYAHHLKVVKKALANATGDTSALMEIRQLLLTAIVLGKSRAELPKKNYKAFIEALELRADELLRRAAADPEAQKVAHRILRQRDHLFTFLKHDGVEPTNNAAERALRPAVVTRKISCGNRTDRGRESWEILASLATTCHQRNQHFARLIARVAPLAAKRHLDGLLPGWGR